MPQIILTILCEIWRIPVRPVSELRRELPTQTNASEPVESIMEVAGGNITLQNHELLCENLRKIACCGHWIERWSRPNPTPQMSLTQRYHTATSSGAGFGYAWARFR